MWKLGFWIRFFAVILQVADVLDQLCLVWCICTKVVTRNKHPLTQLKMVFSNVYCLPLRLYIKVHYRLKGVSIQLHIRLGNPIFFSLMRRNCTWTISLCNNACGIWEIVDERIICESTCYLNEYIHWISHPVYEHF